MKDRTYLNVASKIMLYVIDYLEDGSLPHVVSMRDKIQKIIEENILGD